MGTAPLFLVASALSRLAKHPPLIGTAAMLWGYFSSAARRLPRYEDREFRRFLRRYQYASLLMGKRAAARRMTEERRARWEAAHPAPREVAREGREDREGGTLGHTAAR